MKRRGRPPHPDILTPREWEVLELLRDGLSNPEIAERLGISRDAAKYHISEILSKLGVSDRAEAAAWRASERPWWAAIMAPLAALARRLPLLAKAGAIGASAALLAGLAVLAYAVLATDTRTEDPAAGRASSSPGDDEPTAEVIVPVPDLTLGAEIALPEDVSLLLETGCFQCDGPTTGLIRVSRDGDGRVRRDVLASVGMHSFLSGDGTERAHRTETAYTVGDISLPPRTIDRGKGPEQVKASSAGIAVSADGQEIVVGICYDCANMGWLGLKPRDDTLLFRSTDGGETWKEFGRPEGGSVLSLAGSGRVLMAIQRTPQSAIELFTYPDGASFVHPETATGVFQSPIGMVDGTVVWPDRDGTLRRSDGTLVLRVPESPGEFGPYSISAIAQQTFGDRLIAVAWAANVPPPQGRLSVFSPEGTHIETLKVSDWLYHLAWVSESMLATNISLENEQLQVEAPSGFLNWIPVLLDLESLQIHPIADPFLKAGAEVGRNHVLGVQRR